MHAEEGSGGASILSGPGVPAVRRWIPPTARDVAHISVHLGAGAMKGSPGRRGRKATGRSPRFFGFFFGPIFLPATLELVAAQGLAKSRTKNGGEEARRETLPEAALSISRSAAKAGGDCLFASAIYACVWVFPSSCEFRGWPSSTWMFLAVSSNLNLFL